MWAQRDVIYIQEPQRDQRRVACQEYVWLSWVAPISLFTKIQHVKINQANTTNLDRKQW